MLATINDEQCSMIRVDGIPSGYRVYFANAWRFVHMDWQCPAAETRLYVLADGKRHTIKNISEE